MDLFPLIVRDGECPARGTAPILDWDYVVPIQEQSDWGLAVLVNPRVREIRGFSIPAAVRKAAAEEILRRAAEEPLSAFYPWAEAAVLEARKLLGR